MAAAKSTIPQLDWSEARPAPVVLVTGPERFLADRAANRIRDELRAVSGELEVHDVEASEYTSGSLFTIASPSLFAEPRFIRVAAVEQASDALLADALRYLEQPAEGTTLVLRHGGGQRGRTLLQRIRAGLGGGVEVRCPEITREGDRIGFTNTEFRRLGAQITPGAVRALVAAYQGGLAELASACSQLVADVGPRLAEADVERLTEGRVEAGAFRVADAATAGRAAEALVLLRQSLSTGTDPIPLLAALTMKVRAMARVFGARERSGELASRLGMQAWQVERAQRELRGWSEGELARCVNLAAETEWLLKGGSRDPAYHLERYVLAVAHRGLNAETGGRGGAAG